MKKVKVEKALGNVLAHDITEIVPGKKKGVAFARGKVIESADIERLLDLGKRYLYVFEGKEEGIHEEEAAVRIAEALIDKNMEFLPPKEGKVSILSTVDGLLKVNQRRLFSINGIKDVLLSTLPGWYHVKPGDTIAATRIIPLYIDEKTIKAVEEIAQKGVIRIKPFRKLSAGLVITGSEVFTGRIPDGSPAVEKKLTSYGLTILRKVIVPDEVNAIRDAILSLLQEGTDIVITTAGLSVDPDDVTGEGIEATGAEIIFYGTPVFPGAMFLAAKYNGKYILGAPACVYYNKNTALDVVLPRILAGERVSQADMVRHSYGGLCLNCAVCHFPRCYFGKSV